MKESDNSQTKTVIVEFIINKEFKFNKDATRYDIFNTINYPRLEDGWDIVSEDIWDVTE